MSKTIFARSLMVLVVSYFMFVGVLYQNKASRASQILPSPVPGCIVGLNKVNTSGRCKTNVLANGFREVRFECLGGARGELHARSCVSYDVLKKAANDSCTALANCRITPTLSPRCIPRPACIDEDPPCQVAYPIFGWCPAPLSRTPTPTRRLPSAITPTPCAMPTLPLCEAGAGPMRSEIPNPPGVCGTRYICVTPTPTPAETVTGEI